MDAGEPRVRRRGFFLHSTDGSEPDTGEHENPEGFAVRVRYRHPLPSSPDTSPAAGRSRTEAPDRRRRARRSDQGA